MMLQMLGSAAAAVLGVAPPAVIGPARGRYLTAAPTFRGDLG